MAEGGRIGLLRKQLCDSRKMAVTTCDLSESPIAFIRAARQA